MSHSHIRRLHEVSRQFEATRVALRLAVASWPDYPHTVPGLRELSLTDLQRAVMGREATYLLRLFAEFEAILREFIAAQG